MSHARTEQSVVVASADTPHQGWSVARVCVDVLSAIGYAGEWRIGVRQVPGFRGWCVVAYRDTVTLAPVTITPGLLDVLRDRLKGTHR